MLPGKMNISEQKSKCSNIKSIFTMGIWLVLNISISSINKSLFYFHGFSFPILLTLWHMFLCTIFSLLFIWRSKTWNTFQFIRSSDQELNVFILSFVFCISVASGNIALRYIFVSFSQMIGATTPLVTIFLAQLFTSQKYSGIAMLSTIPMSFGVILCTKGEVNFNLIGFLFLLAALLTRAIKSILSQVLLQEKMNPIVLLFHMGKYSIFILILLVALMEGEGIQNILHNDINLTSTPIIIFILSGLNSFFLNLANFYVVFYTSAVALQVLGNVKVILGIIISIIIFKNEISYLSIIGFVFSLMGVYIYKNSSKPKSSENQTQIHPQK